ncbi:hypothetical protein DK880_00011 [Candidatus Cardinium hertigii]|uniref:Uncharacterized protein n=1 Tax=Candidatus Cardinium hertigii TaxID=247481 RepID=A0A2Z3LG43_9BACT|nr:hypothetical protein DK880_00011 [Candidatus Cardinium hertigii]
MFQNNNLLQGILGNTRNIILCAIGHNLRLITRKKFLIYT